MVWENLFVTDPLVKIYTMMISFDKMRMKNIMKNNNEKHRYKMFRIIPQMSFHSTHKLKHMTAAEAPDGMQLISNTNIYLQAIIMLYI